MYLRSLYPPVPPLSVTNFHYTSLGGSILQQPFPDYVMYLDAVSGEKWTRSEFIERVYDCGTALGSSRKAGGLGLTSEDVVGILSDNCLDYIVLVHSLLALTTPFAPFSSSATPRELIYSLTKSKATHVFVHGNLYQKFLAVALEHGFPENRIYILEGRSNTGTQPPALRQLIETTRQRNIPREPVRSAGKNTLAYLVFSSGTSGLPKAVKISHGNLLYSVMQGITAIQEAMKLRHPESKTNSLPISLSHLPFYHSYGLHFTILRAPVAPATHIIMPRWDLDMALTLIAKYRVTELPAIPSIIHQLYTSPRFEDADLSSVVSFRTGAAHLPPKLKDDFMKRVSPGSALSEAYGMSEATIALIARPEPGLLDGRAELIPESCGILLPGLEAMILRPDGTHCLPNEPGELYVKGDNVALGYWGDEEAMKTTFLANGWLRTGDIFKANNNGTLWFEDRAKDTLKVSGLQVSPTEIEDVLLAVPGGLVKDVAVAGVQTPGARTSDDRSPRAWVVLSQRGIQMGEAEAREALEKWVKESLSKYKWLRGGIKFVPEIPKNQLGKVLRRVLQDQYASELSSRPKL